MSDVIDLAIRLGHLRAALQAGPRAAQTLESTIGPPIKADIEDVARTAFGADMRPFKDKPAKATVTFESRATPTGWRIDFVLSPKGVWWMGQKGAKPHDINSKRRDGRLRAPGRHDVRGPLHHPGTRGKGAIDKAVEVVRRSEHHLVELAIDKVLEEAWNG